MEKDWYAYIVTPGLIRGAQASMSRQISQRLEQNGFADLPQNGSFVLGCVSQTGASAATLVRELGVSKQAVSQLINTLVNRGYLERIADSEDRRRVMIVATAKGKEALALAQKAARDIDNQICSELGDEYLACTRVVLANIIKMKG